MGCRIEDGVEPFECGLQCLSIGTALRIRQFRAVGEPGQIPAQRATDRIAIGLAEVEAAELGERVRASQASISMIRLGAASAASMRGRSSASRRAA